MNESDNIKIKVPRQELDRSSFFSNEETAVDDWVASLPMANLGQATRQLYQALFELNQVHLLPSKRMMILEKLRTPIYYVSRSLSKHYLNKPIVLPEQARKVSDLCHALHTQLAVGYTLVATHTVTLGKRAGASKPEKLIAPALQRAITDYSLNMLRHYQLYEPVKAGIWHQLHQFYCLARQQNLLQNSVEDPEFGPSSVSNSYLRALLLGSCKPNQLRQEDCNELFKPLSHWAGLCTLNPINDRDTFAVDLDSDRAPIYRELLKQPALNHWLSINTEQLILQLQVIHQQADDNQLKYKGDGFQISFDLLNHLTVCWGSMTKRTYMRLATDDQLEISIGLSATHHHVSGKISFEALVEERGAKTFSTHQANPFLKTPSHSHRAKDVWDSPYENNMGKTNVSLEAIDFDIRSNEEAEKAAAKKYYSHSVSMVNSSAHGYCIRWPKETVAQIKTGEIVGIREVHTNNWVIAVIRWVSHNKQEVYLGLQLISPSAAPYGARIIHKTGGQAEYMRVLVLPEISVIKQPITLLTPRVPFRSKLKVVLNQRGKEVQIRLGKKLNEAGAYNQFEFQRVSGTNTNNSSNDSDQPRDVDDFDVLWEQL